MSATNRIDHPERLSWKIERSPSPVNVLWVHTLYEDILKNPESIPERPITGTSYTCPLLNIKYCLEIKRDSETVIISCTRKLLPSSLKPDDGYFLRLYFTVIGVPDETKSTVMHFNETSSSVHYSTESFSACLSHGTQIATIKCVIRMIETCILPGAYLKELEEELQELSSDYSKSQLKNMAYLLKRPKFRDIYTSREVPDTLTLKLNYMIRAHPYSKQLAAYIRAKAQQDEEQMPEIPLDEILGYISSGEEKLVSEEECLILLRNSYRIGLHFLYEIVSDYIISNFSNDFVIDVLKTADALNDRKLLKAGTDYFSANMDEILQSEKWNAHFETSNAFARSILHNIKIERTFENAFVPPGLFEETAEF